MAQSEATTNPEHRTQMRRVPRGYPVVVLPVYDVDDPEKEGLVQDISEEGIQVAGIAVVKNERKTFLIQVEGFFDIKPFSFDAECRWVRVEDNFALCGFEIIGISAPDLEELRKVLKMLVILDSGRTKHV
jgi:hypothetical protein